MELNARHTSSCIMAKSFERQRGDSSKCFNSHTFCCTRTHTHIPYVCVPSRRCVLHNDETSIEAVIHRRVFCCSLSCVFAVRLKPPSSLTVFCWADFFSLRVLSSADPLLVFIRRVDCICCSMRKRGKYTSITVEWNGFNSAHQVNDVI